MGQSLVPKETSHHRLQAKGWLSSSTPCQLLRDQSQVPSNQCFLSATVGDSSTSKEKSKKANSAETVFFKWGKLMPQIV